MYSACNEGKSAIAERFIRTLKNKIYKYITSISKNVQTNKLDNIVNKHNNAYHRTNRTIEIKSVHAKSKTYIDSSKRINDKGPNFKIDDMVRILKYKNTFVEGYTPNLSKEVFVIKKVKNIVPQTYIINDLIGEETVETFYEKEFQK